MNLNISKLKEDFNKFSLEWENTIEYNDKIYDYFSEQVDLHETLKTHYEIISKYELGWGEKAFRYLWALIFAESNLNTIKFLEIGVYKGSILSLSQLIAKELNLHLITYGLTPLNKSGDKYSVYKEEDYKECIKQCFIKTEAPTNNTYIINGLSTEEKAKDKLIEINNFDIIYVDGGHDYNTVVNDIELCDKILNSNGLLILDDASVMLNIRDKEARFKGHYDVALAIKDKLENNLKYKHLFACGHNRVFRKL